MTATDTGIADAVQALSGTLASARRPDSPPDPPPSNAPESNSWRWQAHRQLGDLRDALVAEAGAEADGWTAAREVVVLRERNALLARISTLSHAVLDRADADDLRGDLRRLLDDVRRHGQRLHDLAYDNVELELGGSE